MFEQDLAKMLAAITGWQQPSASTAETILKSETGPDSQAEQGLEEDDG
jgi:hypothetical protein